MSLPSQSSVSAGRSYMYRRRRRRVPRIRVVLLGLALAGAATWAIVDGELFAPADAGAAEEREDGAERSLASDTRSPLTAPPRALTRADRVLDRSLTDAAQRVAGTPDTGGEASGQRTIEPIEIRQGETETGEASGAGAATPGRDEQAKRAGSESDAPRDGSGAAPARSDDPEFRRLMEEAQVQVAKGSPVEARTLMNRALHLRSASDRDRQVARDALSDLNARLVFSPTLVPDDPISLTHVVASGEFLSTIVQKQKLGVDWRAILDINRIPRPESIREGQTIKLIRGPFHAIVSKGEYRLDLYWGPPEQPQDWIYIRSFPAGMGENDSTPAGEFVVKNRLADPAWTNPRTGERFSSSDPENPIGEYWVGLEGLGDSAVHTSYGLHGTIEPESIGRQRSMGCVRLLPDDIRMVFSLMREGQSVVQIRP